METFRIQLLDIHTHHLPAVPGTAVVSVCPPDFRPLPGHLYSAGLHPWHIGQEGQTLEALEAVLRHPQVVAVGEAGLDRLVGAPLAEVQVPLFEAQARLADERGLPLVIHLVKCLPELLAARRRLRPQVPWIIHGFRGKPQLAAECLRHGLHLSFGEHYRAETLLAVPTGRLFLETDESTVPIGTLHDRAAALRGIPPADLRQDLAENAAKCFFPGKAAESSILPTNLG